VSCVSVVIASLQRQQVIDELRALVVGHRHARHVRAGFDALRIGEPGIERLARQRARAGRERRARSEVREIRDRRAPRRPNL
jgi:hypothetical protein